MPPLEDPIPSLLTATDAATKIISLERDLFVLKQELKTVNQIKRAILAGAALILLNLLLTLTFYWIEMGLHESGWSSFAVAVLSFVFFGLGVGLCLLSIFRIGNSHEHSPIRGSHETHKTHQ